MEIKVENAYFVSLQKINDSADGTLCVAETGKDIPFEIKRVFYIYDFYNKKAIRGKHAHRHVEQAIFCIKGSFDILLDDGCNKQKLTLKNNEQGLYLGTVLWNVMTNFSADCVILVFASGFYDSNEYIRDYKEFERLTKKGESS